MSKVEKNEVNTKKCVCPMCPSFNECAKEKNERLYCSEVVGKSGCEYQMSGCICGGCPVHIEFGLKSGYYCMHGSAEEIDGK
jgi:hypothetical protein